MPKKFKHLRLAAAFIGLFLAVNILALFLYHQLAQAPGTDFYFVNADIRGHKFKLEVANNERSREKGLGGKDSLMNGTGMLFVYSQPNVACFWMKDVKFNLDILWFDAERKLIHKQENLSPASYPTSYCPPKPSKYVVEVPGGVAQSLSLEVGDTLTVENL